MVAIEPCSTDREIALRIRARFPIIYIVSHEGRRVEAQLGAIRKELSGAVATRPGNGDGEEAERAYRPFYVWTCTAGLRCGDRPLRETTDPLKALNAICPSSGNERGDGIYVFHDLHPFMERRYPDVIRKLRDIAEIFPGLSCSRTLVIVSPIQLVPPELEKEMAVIDYPLPSADQLGEYLQAHKQDMESSYGPTCVDLNPQQRQEFLQKSVGLTYNEVVSVWARSLEKNRKLDRDSIQGITEEKRQIIEKSGLLEYYPSTETFEKVGGLDRLKAWLRQRENAFKGQDNGRRLPPLKGILLMGVPGCGKSLSAKAVAAEWRLPLVRLDAGRIYGGLLGESEARFRSAIKVVERLAPIVLWIDEVEKGFPQTSAMSDSGTSQRVLASLLTWMQEKKEQVFVVATANDIGRMPWELTRKGRFDQIFYVGLPAAEERSQILRIHLGAHGVGLSSEQVEALVNQMDNFTGSEIEQAVKDTLFEVANLDDSGGFFRALTSVVGQVRPLAQRLEDNPQLTVMHDRARQIAISASSEPKETFPEPHQPLAGWRR